jgi:hypothetical protein
MELRAGTVSTAMIVVAPISFAPAVAHRPIGPCAKTATVSPIRMPPLSAGEAGGHDVRTHQHLLVGQVIGHGREIRHRIRDEHVLGLTAVDRVPELPAAGGLPAVRRAGAVL